MKRLLQFADIFRTIKYLGIFQSISYFFFKNKKNKKLKFKVKNYKNNFTIRCGTSDPWVFDMNILREEYKGFIQKSPKTILDGGANIGGASRYWHKQYPEATIIAVEPDPENFEILTENTSEISKISCVQGGIWSSDTKLSFENDKAWKYSLQVVEDNINGKIQAYSIPSLMEKFNWDFIDVLKLDVEGSEVEILSKNTEPWIDKIGTLILELHPDIDYRCSRILFKAFSNRDFILKWRGENLILIFKS